MVEVSFRFTLPRVLPCGVFRDIALLELLRQSFPLLRRITRTMLAGRALVTAISRPGVVKGGMTFGPQLIQSGVYDKGKPVARRGRKATDLQEVAELPSLNTVVNLYKVLFACAFAAALVALSAHSAKAEGISFRDDFDSFNSSRWIKSDHMQGRSYLDPDNVVVDNGYLKLRVPAGTTDGAEIESVDYYGYGTYRARMKMADAPSSITGFFLYRSPDLYSEIDIEVYNDGTGNVDFVTYADGQRTHYVGKDFRFDPSADFHNYRIDYNPGSVQFYVDGNLRQTWTDGVPDASMKLLVNTWFPTWLSGQAPQTGTATRIDWIDYDQR